MNSEHKRGVHPAFGPSGRSASVLTNDPWKSEVPELSASELMEFLEDFPGQLATVTAIKPASPRRLHRLMRALGRGVAYFVHSLEDVTDIYDR